MLGNHPALGEEMSVFLSASQRVEPVGMLMGPGQPSICLAS
jgi:hypothetical protein